MKTGLKITIKGQAGAGKSTAAYFIKRALEPLGFECTIEDFDIAMSQDAELEKIMSQRKQVKAFKNIPVRIKTIQRVLK